MEQGQGMESGRLCKGRREKIREGNEMDGRFKGDQFKKGEPGKRQGFGKKEERMKRRKEQIMKRGKKLGEGEEGTVS